MIETVLFIRHAETHLAGRFCGQSDPPVNERGQQQIKRLVKMLESESIDVVYTSDLVRAFATADAIGRVKGLLPIAISELREIGFGEWEGLSWEEIDTRDQTYAHHWSKFYPEQPPPGGERFGAFQSRVLTAVESILTLSSPRVAAIVTHSGVMRVVLRALCGVDEQEAWDRTREYCGFFHYQHGRRA